MRGSAPKGGRRQRSFGWCDRDPVELRSSDVIKVRKQSMGDRSRKAARHDMRTAMAQAGAGAGCAHLGSRAEPRTRRGQPQQRRYVTVQVREDRDRGHAPGGRSAHTALQESVILDDASGHPRVDDRTSWSASVSALLAAVQCAKLDGVLSLRQFGSSLLYALGFLLKLLASQAAISLRYPHVSSLANASENPRLRRRKIIWS